MDLVVDASVALKWLIKEEQSDVALALMREQRMAAPALLLIECRNALLTRVRRRLLTAPEAQAAESNINLLPIAIFPTEPLLPQAFLIALQLAHPIYDCVYLAAAKSADVILITADIRFAAAAKRSSMQGIRLLSELP